MHLDEGTIHAWLDGALDAAESERVERHAAECAACAAAVAEARGLVAGASRILGALDHVPGGVVPRPAAGAAATRQARPLWRVLRFTPARAAAAAVLILAAGTTLVLRNQPNAAVAIDTEAGPEVLENGPVTPRAAAPAPLPSALPAPSPAVTNEPRPGTRVAAPVAKATTRKAAVGRAAAADIASSNAPPAVAGSAVVRQSVASMADSTRVALDSVTVTAKAVTANAEAAPRTKAFSAQRPMALAAPAPSPAAEGAAALRTASGALAGCYAVEADSLAGLPPHLSLDTTFVVRRASANARWEPLGAAGVRLHVGARVIDLSTVSPGTLAGTVTVDGRVVTVRLVRAVGCSVP